MPKAPHTVEHQEIYNTTGQDRILNNPIGSMHTVRGVAAWLDTTRLNAKELMSNKPSLPEDAQDRSFRAGVAYMLNAIAVSQMVILEELEVLRNRSDSVAASKGIEQV